MADGGVGFRINYKGLGRVILCDEHVLQYERKFAINDPNRPSHKYTSKNINSILFWCLFGVIDPRLSEKHKAANTSSPIIVSTNRIHSKIQEKVRVSPCIQ